MAGAPRIAGFASGVYFDRRRVDRDAFYVFEELHNDGKGGPGTRGCT
jgi:hypothetical protein